jgi:membrane fusion protein, adhesin transport system
MASDFRQTSSALRADQDRNRRSLVVFAISGALLALTAAWASLARVPVFAVSEFARLQARDEVHPVDALVSGRVLTVHLPVGGKVAKGDVLVALDASDVSLRLEEARASERGLGAQIAALEQELEAREQSLATTGTLGRASISEAQANRTETQAEASLAAREQERATAMRVAGVVADSEADRASATMAQTAAAVAAHDRRMTVLSTETQRDLSDRRAANQGRRRELAALTTQRDSVAIQLKRLEVELERHTVRAPISGRLGQIRAPQVGSVVAVGQTIAVVTPDTALELVADFRPADAIGRVRPGQVARMRVTGFPWGQYGVLTAKVAAVSSEVSDGHIRVQLELDPHANPRIPLDHGLVGEVEVELEQVSPATMLARAAGQLFDKDPEAATTPR